MSKIEVNAIEPQCGTTLTIGASDTSIAGIGTVNWDTTAKTAAFTAVSGRGYFVNTTSGTITVTLPATPSAGDIVAVSDYAKTAETNNITVARNSSNIEGDASDLVIQRNGVAMTFVYVDATRGWKIVNSGAESDKEPVAEYIEATGGTVVTCGDFKTHIFTSPGTFCVSSVGNAIGSDSVDYLVVAGGGGGGSRQHGAGGGAGGFRLSNSFGLSAPTMSPLANPTGVPVSVTAYPITVGGGGAGGPFGPTPNNCGTAGNNSVYSTITSAGGGFGATYATTGGNGGSGGGGGGQNTGGSPGGTGNTPPVSPPQGQNGGTGSSTSPCGQGGGGGGAGTAGEAGGVPSTTGRGGTGSFISDSFIGPTSPSYGTSGPVGSTRYFAGGGSGATSGSPLGPAKPGPAGGGGGGSPTSGAGEAGTTNTGGGGGAGTGPNGDVAGGAGGSGIVIIRYKFQ